MAASSIHLPFNSGDIRNNNSPKQKTLCGADVEFEVVADIDKECRVAYFFVGQLKYFFALK